LTNPGKTGHFTICFRNICMLYIRRFLYILWLLHYAYTCSHFICTFYMFYESFILCVRFMQLLYLHFMHRLNTFNVCINYARFSNVVCTFYPPLLIYNLSISVIRGHQNVHLKFFVHL
jgi:hypothetical protein